MDQLFLPVLEGTVREGRRSIHVARLIVNVANEYEQVESVLVDPRELHLPGDGNDDEVRDKRYSDITLRADGFVIVAPEYNHSIPGSLKRMLDSELKNYIHKPVAFAGVSAGPWGGIRAIESLVPMVREMGLVATFTDVQFPGVQNLFSDSGELQDEAYVKRVKRMLDELIWMATVLKQGRNDSPVAA